MDDVTADNNGSDTKSQADTNYLYDKIGNLVKNTKDSTHQIRWTVCGKIACVNKADNSYMLVDSSMRELGRHILATQVPIEGSK